MTTTYRITEDDYVNAMRLFGRFTPRALAILAGMATILTGLTLFGGATMQGLGEGGLIGGAIALLLTRSLISPLLARRLYRNYRAIHDELGVECREQGIHFSSPNGQGTVTWDKILKWRENESYILIYPMPRLYHIIPKAVAAKGFDIPALIERLTRHVGKPC